MGPAAVGALPQDAECDGASERLVPVLGTELGVDAHEVGLHGREGDREVVGDLPVGAAFGEQDEDLALAGGEELVAALVEGRQPERADDSSLQTAGTALY